MNKCSIEWCERPIYLKKDGAFCYMHYQRNRRGADMNKKPYAPRGGGSVWKNKNGYIYFQFGDSRKRYLAHIFAAETALGKKLPVGVEVHHVNGNRSDNQNSNLVICPNASYHSLLHMRMKALEACGNPEWRKCGFCKKYSSLELLRMVKCKSGKSVGETRYEHAECKREYRRKKLREQKAQIQSAQLSADKRVPAGVA